MRAEAETTEDLQMDPCPPPPGKRRGGCSPRPLGFQGPALLTLLWVDTVQLNQQSRCETGAARMGTLAGGMGISPPRYLLSALLHGVSGAEC